MSNQTTFKNKIKDQLPIIIISLVCVVLIFIVNHFTKERILENKQRAEMAIIDTVLPIEYNNDLFTDKTRINVPTSINPSGEIDLYIAKQDNRVVAISMTPVISKGYGGQIHLIIGIDFEGTLLGLRILQHNETDGFGDQVHQDKSDWLTGITGYKYNDLKESQWALKKDGGEFDQLSGATVTSRSILQIVYQVLQFYSENRDTLIK